MALGACETSVKTHGYRLADEDLARIRPGFTSQGEVAALLGTPSTRAAFDEGDWYYVHRRVEQRTFYNRRLASQEVVHVAFDDRGIVRAVERYDVDDAHAVEPVDAQTPTGGNDLSIVEQFIGNIGRFNPPTGGP